MTQIQTPQQAREKAKVLQTGRWYIAELDDPQLVVQGESEADARQKLVKRWEEYTKDSDESEIKLDDPNTDPGRTEQEIAPSHF